MIGFRSRFLLVIAATVVLAATAWAEGIFPVNDAGTGAWVFDQPSVVGNGTVLHVAFVGDSAAGAEGTPNTRLYYAAVNGAADFRNKATTRSQVLLTAPVAIDNGDAYTGARHPQIALRTATELVILFQAIPVGETDYKLFRAVLTIGNNVVTSQRVDEIRDAADARIPGNLTDPSFAIVTTDNTLRVAFSSFPSLVAGSPFSDVYYARVGLDTARVVNNTILLTTSANSTGVSPLPRLRLDANRSSHVVWAANNSTGDPYGNLLRDGARGRTQRRGQPCDRRHPGPLGRIPLGIPQRAPDKLQQCLDPRLRRIPVRGIDGVGGIRSESPRSTRTP